MKKRNDTGFPLSRERRTQNAAITRAECLSMGATAIVAAV
jgi:hypothetical protein